LSPLLFVFVMEALSRMITAAVSGGVLDGFRVGDASFSHLLFADDTLIFCDASSSKIRSLRSLLLLFEVVSGLKVNLAKSSIIPVGNVANVGRLADFLECEVAYLPVMYLGLPWGLLTSLLVFGMELLRRLKHGWLVGKGYTSLREGE
jgi:hypothetical protein